MIEETGTVASTGQLQVRLARDEHDLHAAQRLRYRVFIAEMGGDGPLVDHQARRERDELDPFFDHLLLIDTSRREADSQHVVGAYRLMPDHRREQAGRFYSESEFDLDCLRNSGRRLLELGRSCVAPDYRGGAGMLLLWQGLAEYVARNGVDLLFGVASFHGTRPRDFAQALGLLHHHHLAPPNLRPRARIHEPMDLLPACDIDRRQAMAQMPSLIRAYLRIGGMVGDGAFVDHAFGTTDICLLLEADRAKGAFLRPMPAPMNR